MAAISTGPRGNRVYFGYGTNKGGILQIVDREKLLNGPKEPTPDNLRAPVIGELQMSPLVGAHTVFPLGKIRIPEFAGDKFGAERDMVMIVDESLVNECGRARRARWCGSSMPRSRSSRWWCRTTRRRRAISASAAGASARIRRTRAWRRCSTASSPS